MKLTIAYLVYLGIIWALASQLDPSGYEASPNYDPSVDAGPAMLGGDQP
jgi:hypothetical protein